MELVEQQRLTGTLQTSQRPWTSFESALASIILRSRVASSLPALAPVEFTAAVEAWAQIVRPFIPESRLDDAYLRAMADKGSGFALGASELVKGFRDLCESERAAPRLGQDRNLLPGEVCKKCFGTGWQEFIEGGYKQVRKCDHVTPDDEDMSMF